MSKLTLPARELYLSADSQTGSTGNVGLSEFTLFDACRSVEMFDNNNNNNNDDDDNTTNNNNHYNYNHFYLFINIVYCLTGSYFPPPLHFINSLLLALSTCLFCLSFLLFFLTKIFCVETLTCLCPCAVFGLSLIHISEPTRRA